MDSSSRRGFVQAYLSEVGDLRNSISRLQLYEAAIAAGKNLFLSDIEDADSYQFDEAYAIFEKLPATDFIAVTELCASNRTEGEQQQQFIHLSLLIKALEEDEEMNSDEKKRVLNFLESSASYKKLDYRKLFNEFEATRIRLLNFMVEKSTRKQNVTTKSTTLLNTQQKSSQRGTEIWESFGSATKFSSEIRRRAFCLINNDEERILYFHFALNQPQIICIECELMTSNDQPSERHYDNDILLVLYDVIEEQVVTTSVKAIENKYISEDCLLKAGEYAVTICSLKCLRYVDSVANKNKIELVGPDGKLTKHFKMTLMNVFDLFDFDENGTLSREEFDIYNKLASDEHVSDQEWDILCKNFQTKNDELLLSSFVALHQVEANNDRSMEDTWISLLCVGYDEQLNLIGNCPCSFTILSELDIRLESVELRESTENEDEALACYFWNNGQEIDSEVDVRIWKCDYFAVCVAGPMKLPFAMNIDYSSSKNVLVREQTGLHRIPLKLIKPKILLKAIAKEPKWSLIVMVETTT